MDEKNPSPTPSAGTQAVEPNPVVVTPMDLKLKPGTRIQLGFRKGVVDQVRGSWKKPYDVRVRWDDEKYPVFVTYRGLELEFAKGRLKVL